MPSLRIQWPRLALGLVFCTAIALVQAEVLASNESAKLSSPQLMSLQQLDDKLQVCVGTDNWLQKYLYIYTYTRRKTTMNHSSIKETNQKLAFPIGVFRCSDPDPPEAGPPFRNALPHHPALLPALPQRFARHQCTPGDSLYLGPTQLPTRPLPAQHRPFISVHHGGFRRGRADG